MKNVHLIYYSPSLTTRKVMRAIGKGMNVPVREYDITEGLEGSLSFDEEDLVVFGVPVYSSRVPGQMQHMLQWIKGNKTPSVLVCVYGNRDYDEALMELRDITSANGFSPIAAATFIAQHSIFPKMGANRPDEKDLEIINEFGKECYQRYLSYNPENEYQINVKGSYPLKEPSGSPFAPTGNDDCDDCGTCIKHCPVQAIPASDPTTQMWRYAFVVDAV